MSMFNFMGVKLKHCMAHSILFTAFVSIIFRQYMSSTNSSTAGTYVNIEFGYCIQKSQKNIHINNKTEQNEKNGDCQLQNITYLTQCFPLSMGRCYVSHNEYYNNKHHIPVYLSYDFQFQQKTHPFLDKYHVEIFPT